MADLVFHGSRDDFYRVVDEFVSAAVGHGPDPNGVIRGLQLRCGVALLSKVQHAFLVKSRGGVGSDGIQWQPLKPETIAYGRRITKSEMKATGGTGRGPRPTLTAAQDAMWRRIYGTRLARFRLEMSESEAKSRAASIAWAEVKRAGGKTKLELFGGRQVDIGRDTGRLFRSLSAGVDARPSGEADQVFRVTPGTVIVGTNVVYAERFHKDRPLWPETIPEEWSEAIGRAALRGAVDAIVLIASKSQGG